MTKNLTPDPKTGIICEFGLKQKIHQRRRQMIVHSYIYYEMNTSIVSDKDWTRWAMELVKLQEAYPEIAREVDYWEDFQDWDGSTGFHLPFWKYPWLVNTAHFLVKMDTVNHLSKKRFPIKEMIG